MTYTANDPKAMREAFVTRITSQTSKNVGEGVAPEDRTTPYAVIYPLADQASMGTQADPDADVWWLYQITCVGADMDETQWMQDSVRSALLGWQPSVSGVTCSLVELQSGSGTTRDPSNDVPLFYSTDRFRVFTSPT